MPEYQVTKSPNAYQASIPGMLITEKRELDDYPDRVLAPKDMDFPFGVQDMYTNSK